MRIDATQFESMRRAGAYITRKKEERSQKWVKLEVICLFLAIVVIVLVEVLA